MFISVGLCVLIVIIGVCITMGAYLAFTFQSSSARRSKRSRSNAKELQIARDQVARFYGTNRTATPWLRPNIGKMESGHLETMKLMDKTQNHKTGIVCDIQIPPLHTTVPCAIQPDLETSVHKQRLTRALSDGYHASQYRLKYDSWSHIKVLPKLSEPNLGEHRSLLRGSSLFSRTYDHPSPDSVTLMRGYRSSMDKFIDPMLRILTATSSRSSYYDEENWTNVNPNLNGSGQICFSLSYTCTFGLLNVTINRLTGVTHVTKVESALPSQVTNNFVVGLRIRHLTNRPKSEINDLSYKTSLTQPISTSHNPTFDQSFPFKINLADLDQTELVFTVLTSTSTAKHSTHVDRRRTRSAASLDYPYDQIRRVKMFASEEMRCIGVVFYKLSRHELINCGEKLQNIWQPLQVLPDFEDVRHAEKMNDYSLPKAGSTNNENEDSEIESIHSYQRETSSNNSDCSQQGVNEIHVSMIYRKSTSSLEIQLNEVRGTKIRKSDVRLFIRATLCRSTKHIASSQSNYTKISISEKTKSTTRKSSNPEDFSFANSFRPRGKSVSFSIGMQDLIHTRQYGILLHLYARNRIGLTRRLGRCNFGAQEFTDGPESEHWTRLIESVKTLQSNPHLEETDLISYWHVLMS